MYFIYDIICPFSDFILIQSFIKIARKEEHSFLSQFSVFSCPFLSVVFWGVGVEEGVCVYLILYL